VPDRSQSQMKFSTFAVERFDGKGVNDALKTTNWLESFFESLRGILLFRSGRAAESIPGLEYAISTPAGSDEQPDLFILAMAYQELGRTNDAKRVFARGMAANKQTEVTSKVRETWQARAINRSLRKEAEERLGANKDELQE
jgi:hypothetical protein